MQNDGDAPSASMTTFCCLRAQETSGVSLEVKFIPSNKILAKKFKILRYFSFFWKK